MKIVLEDTFNNFQRFISYKWSRIYLHAVHKSLLVHVDTPVNKSINYFPGMMYRNIL